MSINNIQMKKENVPQDLSALGRHTKEMCYAIDDSGNYTTELSTGWEIKVNALDVAWDDIKNRILIAKQKVINKEASPILFFMEYRLMDMDILSAYTGFWKWQIKNHLKANVFDKLSDKKLQKYAEAFNVKAEDIKQMKTDED